MTGAPEMSLKKGSLTAHLIPTILLAIEFKNRVHQQERKAVGMIF
jgi:hypothetical protein